MVTPSDAAPVTIEANGWVFDGLTWQPPGGAAAGTATVLCLHGFPQRCTSWSAVAARLVGAGLRVVAPDQRGYSPGARPSEVDAYALPALVADVVAMIEVLGGPVHLVGHDWGGVVGWRVALARPDLVASWTAVSTPAPQALAAALAADADERARFAYISFFRQEGTAERALLADDGAGLAAVYGGYVAADRVAEDVAFFATPGVLTAALSWYRAMSRSDAAPPAAVQVPTAFVWGSEDVAFSRLAADGTAEHVAAEYHYVPLEGASHWLPDERPEEVADAVLAVAGG